jgi:hypothetical protein
MNAPATEEILRSVAAQTEKVMEKTMAEAADDLRKLLSVPVNRATRPPTRSKLGEYPRRDSGRLQASVSWVVFRVANFKVRGTIGVSTPYAQYVDNLRHYKAMFEDRWKQKVEVRIQASLR